MFCKLGIGHNNNRHEVHSHQARHGARRSSIRIAVDADFKSIANVCRNWLRKVFERCYRKYEGPEVT